MAWIESHQSLSRHRKTLRAVALLKIDRHKFLGHLHELWWWGLDNVPPDGFLGDLSDREIAESAGWARSPEAFIHAITDAGFIDDRDGGRYLHDWFDYAGKYLSKKAANAARQKAFRDRDRLPIYERDRGRCRYCGKQLPRDHFYVDHVIPVERGGTNDDSNRVTACNPCNVRKNNRTPDEAGMPLLPIYGGASRNALRDASREEKRREEKNPHSAAADDSELRSASSLAGVRLRESRLPDALSRANDQLVPFVQRGYVVDADQLERAAALFPGLNLEVEFAKIAAYLDEPKRSRQVCSWKFILDWLDREQRRQDQEAQRADAAEQRESGFDVALSFVGAYQAAATPPALTACEVRP